MQNSLCGVCVCEIPPVQLIGSSEESCVTGEGYENVQIKNAGVRKMYKLIE